MRLDDHLGRGGVPADADGAGAELLLDGVERIVVDELDGSAGGHAPAVALDLAEPVEDLVDLLREQGRLLLLEGDAHDLRPRARLQVERPGPGTPEGPDDDPVRPVELMNMGGHVGHGTILGVGPSAVGFPAPPPTAASPARAPSASQDRSPESVLLARTLGLLAP